MLLMNKSYCIEQKNKKNICSSLIQFYVSSTFTKNVHLSHFYGSLKFYRKAMTFLRSTVGFQNVTGIVQSCVNISLLLKYACLMYRETFPSQFATYIQNLFRMR